MKEVAGLTVTNEDAAPGGQTASALVGGHFFGAADQVTAGSSANNLAGTAGRTTASGHEEMAVGLTPAVCSGRERIPVGVYGYTA
jgi:hypothetical protein